MGRGKSTPGGSLRVRARFFVEDALEGPRADVPPAEARHAAVRRLRPGDRVELLNGRGVKREGLLEARPEGGLQVRFLAPPRRAVPPDVRLHLAVSPPKGDRMNFLVEKLSELGADTCLPLVCRRSVDAGVRRETGRVERWRRTAREACKQCGRAFLMAVEPPRPLEDLVREGPAGRRWIVLLPQGKETVSLRSVLEARPLQAGEEAMILVGPEGGFTPEEEGAILAAGARPASLGRGILRIETAALAAAALFRAFHPGEGEEPGYGVE